MLHILTSGYSQYVIDQIKICSHSIDLLVYVAHFNLYKKSDHAHLIFLALKKFAALSNSVRIVFDYPKRHKSNFDCNSFSARRFKEANFSVRFLHSGSTQHAKLFIFDQRLAIFGSHNLTSKSVVNPYDISLALDDLHSLAFFNSYFDSIWCSSLEA